MSRVRSSSSRQAVAREDRVAKRNPELARACTGGGVPFSLRWWVSEEHLFRFFLHLRVALLPFPPALASPSFRLAGQGVALTLCSGFRQCVLFPLGEGGQTEWCICWSLLRVLAGCRFFGNHCSCGKWGIVNHRPRVYPMHHSVLPEEGGVESRGRSSSLRRVLAR